MKKNIGLSLNKIDYCEKCKNQPCDHICMWVKNYQHFKKCIKDFNFDKMNSNYYYRNNEG